MKPTLRDSLQSNCNLEKFIVFDINSYRFSNIRTNKNYDYVKTCLNRKLSQQQLQIITKFRHKNIISLKKISKSKRNNQQVFWLYYEAVPYTIQQAFQQANIDVNPLSLQLTLTNITNYVISERIYPQISYENVGVNEFGEIKIYLSAEMILKSAKNFKQISLVDKKIKQILISYRKLYHQRTSKQLQLVKSHSQNQMKINSPKANQNQDFKITYQYKPPVNTKVESRKNILQDSQHGKSAINLCQQKKLIQSFTKKDQISLIKLKQVNSKDKQKKVQKNNINSKDLKQINSNAGVAYLHPAPQIMKDFDTQSIDTYQMQMGEDFQMPSIRTNQKLRQTLVNSKQSWDALTYKTNIKQNANNNVHQSAGAKNFKSIIDKNKQKIKVEKKQKQFDSKTMHDNKNFVSGKNWQNSTIKSTLAPNIQDKIQQALAKTRLAMEMLNRAKSSPPKK